jgi:type III restriction enzyme
MALHPDFPESPHVILDPDIRWFPADETLRETSSEKLLPPLVPELRKLIKKWRDDNYQGATDTSRTLLNWWFNKEHLLPSTEENLSEFKYYFGQREAVETIVYLYDVVGVKDKYDLMRFDSSGAVSTGMFDETWRRFVIKMATGTGKTKVMSLLLAWCYFHKLYEPDSELARNFLIIAPNIIVLDRLYKDFKGLSIFFEDPVLPENGIDGQNWQDDFQLTLHLQDDVNITRPTGNIFLTNIHRVYASNDIPPTPDDENTMDYFLGKRPTGATTDSKVDLGDIVRDIDELVILNDEAHHIHDPRMAWFKSIEDIHNRLKQKDDSLSLQIDVTATPKHNNGAIFVQTVADYPLVEAISQNVVKHPVLPDSASRAKLEERKSSKFTEKYTDYLHLGVIEWRKAYDEHIKMDKKSILFVMTDDTKNCDEVAEYLESTYQDLKDAVLVIHTKNNGEISEAASGKSKEELDFLRKQANDIDSLDSKYKAIVSVLVLKEGWDVRNVTTIVGLRAYTSKSNILPEQTLGRGLRKMYPDNPVEEYVSVVGTDAFMDFVESIQAEGVVLERKAMGEGTKPKTPIVIEIDNENEKKDLDKLDIEIPVLSPRIYREYKKLTDLDMASFGNEKVEYQQFSEEEQREIVFRDITTGEITHTTVLDKTGIADYRSVIGYFTQTIMKDLRLVSGYDVLYGKVKDFTINHLFNKVIDLDTANTLRNLSEITATRTIIETFKKKINELTIQDKGDAEIRDTIKLKNTRPFVAKEQGYLIPNKSIFNKIIGDSHLELLFARFLEDCDDIISYAKNYLAVHFKLDYVNADGDIKNYYPDFIVNKSETERFIIETKGLVDLDVPHKMQRLKQWCEDINKIQSEVNYDFVYVDEEGFNKYKPKTFDELIRNFKEYNVT